VSGLIEMRDERDLHLKLFPAIGIYVQPFLPLFFVGNYNSLTWVPAAFVWLMYILSVVVALKKVKYQVYRLQR
jgi:hypothetical protein